MVCCYGIREREKLSMSKYYPLWARIGSSGSQKLAMTFAEIEETAGVPVGDATLQDSGEISIVICREYQNRHIGRKCAAELIRLVKEKGFAGVKANIYSFNTQSRAMFLACGFTQDSEEWYSCCL